ncbi:protein FAM136A-like [Centruroides sculpturatus]|uniref:protein FAM136A-like n=1 Tax=Centruroides sculpturatus TaxID=218467 RepID=UPI000C6EDADD|nr:protein FAM136A-like [Centruroides sculpturatus]
MAHEAQTRVQTALNNLLQDLDKSHLRKMQGDMHRCAAKCCDLNTASMEEVHQCIQNCSKNVSVAQSYVENELTNYQGRIERCVLQCRDNIQDKMSTSPSEKDMKAFESQFHDCIGKCADTHVELLPTLLKKMREMLSKGNYSSETS